MIRSHRREQHRRDVKLYTKRLTKRARGRLTKAEIKAFAGDLIGFRCGSSDPIGGRTRGAFARDFAELSEYESAQVRTRERDRFVRECRGRFFGYGPSVWPEDMAVIRARLDGVAA